MKWRRLYSCCEPSSKDYDSSSRPPSEDDKSDDEFVSHDVEPRPLQQQQQLQLKRQEQEQELLQQQHTLQQLQQQQQRRHQLHQQGGEEGDEKQQLTPTSVASLGYSQAVAVVQRGREREANGGNNRRTPIHNTDIGHQDHQTNHQLSDVSKKEQQQRPPRKRAGSIISSPRLEDLGERRTGLDNRSSSGSESKHLPVATDDTKFISPTTTDDTKPFSPTTEDGPSSRHHSANEEEEVRTPPHYLTIRVAVNNLDLCWSKHVDCFYTQLVLAPAD